MIYSIHSIGEDRSYSTVVIKDEQRFCKRILIMGGVAVTLTFKAVIEDSNDDPHTRIEVCM